MGNYLNPDNALYNKERNRRLYVDKSLLIPLIEDIALNDNHFICVAKPRRFGKSTDAYMLIAYYSKGCDSSLLFNELKIAHKADYKMHLNQDNVIYLDMQYFYDKKGNAFDMIDFLTKAVLRDILKEYGDVDYLDNTDLSTVLDDIYDQCHEQFIFIFDEWDCVLRDKDATKDEKEFFLKFMNALFKGKSYVKMAYMTGILPIKKYGNESAINMFKEISMLDSTPLEEFMGFTEDEVKQLCLRNNMDFNEMSAWYDGYHLSNDISIFSPRSIITSISDKKYGNYWSGTASFENLKSYISSNFDGLKDAIHRLLIGEKINVDTSTFSNDMATVQSKDDVLTLLIHLGYLAYDSKSKSAYIPNKEVTDSFISVVKEVKWPETMKLIERADKLLQATWNLDEETVAQVMEEVHESYVTSPLKYNNEEALSTTILMAYYTANDYYTIVRELPSGKGYCDIGLIPKDPTNPAMIIELKWNKSVDKAIDQINERNYPKAFEHYKDNLLLVGISYESDSRKKGYKQHICKIKKAC
ncbi:MAG: ATP-binding protein [Erysipelotrichaceae bacterium]|nr:ATP-binding protein [Erysipelotrichaceae bacterium]